MKRRAALGWWCSKSGGVTVACVDAEYPSDMARWIATAVVGAASSFAAAFVSSGFARVILLLVAAGTLMLLAYWGAKSEIRIEENHRRILDLSEQVVATAETAQAAHAQAYRPVAERRAEEDYELIVKPIDDAAKRAWSAITKFVAGTPARPTKDP